MNFKDIEKKIFGSEQAKELFKLNINKVVYLFNSPNYFARLMASKYSDSLNDETISGFYSILATMCFSIHSIDGIKIEELMKSDENINTIEKVGNWILNNIFSKLDIAELSNITAEYLKFISKETVKIDKISIENVVDIDSISESNKK